MLEIREAWRPLKLLGAHAQEDRDDERHPHQAVAYAIERHHRRHRPVISLAEQKEKNDVGRGTEHDDRKSVVKGTSVSVRVDLRGRRIIKKKNIQPNQMRNI